MKKTFALILRNTKLFFRDKGMFITALITPLILLGLYAAFLGRIYRDSFASGLPAGGSLPEELLDATVGGQLVSSLLAVCCVSVAFCSNLMMIQDKVTGARRDLTMAPVGSASLSLGYFVSCALVTLIICFVALAAGLLYLGVIGWYLTLSDVLILTADVLLLGLFGTALSSVVIYPLSTNGQASAVGTIISAGYGFICGAYMPLSSFAEGLQRVLSFLPGTYGTSLLRNHTLRGVFGEMEALGLPPEVIRGLRDAVDCNFYFFGTKVTVPAMYAVIGGATLLLIGLYILINALTARRRLVRKGRA